jgi:hypothetical protein
MSGFGRRAGEPDRLAERLASVFLAAELLEQRTG